MSNKSGISSQVISLPKSGGAIHGIGEKFAPDLHTGTGNFTFPIALPAGRNGFQPHISLGYSTGNGNSPFGLGWNLSLPGVSCQTNKGIPKYDGKDTFVLSGAEDLVAVEAEGGRTRYQPRTEGLFALIYHHHDASNNYWEVASKDGLTSIYGTLASRGNDAAAIADPLNRHKVFAWKLTATIDPFGNRIEYRYERDALQTDGPHHWDQLYLTEIRYIDFGDPNHPGFLASVRFNYEDRPDPFSEYRAGFEIRTIRRCKNIQVFIKPGNELLTKTYHLIYLDQYQPLPVRLPANGVSLLSKVVVEGHLGDNSEQLPPLEFRYSGFEPEKRNFFPLTGPDLPPGSLARPEYELADLFGDGLPDIVQIDGTIRYWRNLGQGRFDRPRFMRDAPAGLRLSDPGVQLIDADGEGRIDLLVTNNTLNGYFPLDVEGAWHRRSFKKYEASPSFSLEDPEVKLVDLTGDGTTDAIRSGSRMECYFNDPRQGWKETTWIERQAIEIFPDVNFSDSRIKWGDLSGDGLQDILMVHDGQVAYWPNLGYGRWGKQVTMRNSPRLPYGYNPKHILVGDIDGDGLDDIVHVEHNKVTLWINQSGNNWSDPVVIKGTPPVSDIDAVRLADMLGTGICGVLWSMDAGGLSRHHLFFLDFTGGTKPYLLTEMDNHMGASTKVGYTSSTSFYLQDRQQAATRWKTSLPFPVQVVGSVEVIDHFSKGKQTTTYHYHHGHWDGSEREFRGFGRVDQRDTQSFEQYNAEGLHGQQPFKKVNQLFSPPLETRTWFHQGPVGGESGDWKELDYSDEFWPGDPQALTRPPDMQQVLRSLPRRIKRDAFRSLRGSILRTELYALDNSEFQPRPYTVTESQYGLRQEAVPADQFPDRKPIFFPFTLARRTAQWERGAEPLHQFTFMGEYDPYGQLLFQASIAVPRNRDFRVEEPAGPEVYLGTCTETTYISRQEGQPYIVDRVARVTSTEILNDGRPGIFQLWQTVKEGKAPKKVIGQTLHFYDGEAFVGLPFQQIGQYGALVRSESLVLTKELLYEAYSSTDTPANPAELPPYMVPGAAAAWTADYPVEFQGLPALAGYVWHAAEPGSPYTAGFFAMTERSSYDFQEPANSHKFGLIKTRRDSLGNDTTITYNEPGHPYYLLPARVTDAAGLTIQATYHYHSFQPHTVTDINDNISEFNFTPLGLLQNSFLKGKGQEGDQQSPGLQLEYGLMAYEESPAGDRQPVFVRTIRRVHHDTDTDIALPGRHETITTVEYSDGFGRLLQTRTQAEKIIFGNEVFGGTILPADQLDAAGTGSSITGTENNSAGSPNVVVSGWQVYDNKGQVIEKYEPFYSSGWAYAASSEAEKGQKIVMLYDPRGQLIRTINPDGSQQLVVRGKPLDPENPYRFAPTPWETYTYDANDNAGRTHAGHPSVEQYRHHWNTPARILIDALGRTVETVVVHRPPPANPADILPPPEAYITRFIYDIRGNVVTIIDPLDRKAFRNTYDLLNRKLRAYNFDAGVRRTILNAAGNPVEMRDSKGALTLRRYDALSRPVKLWARDETGQPVTLREHLIYGDSPESGLNAAQRNMRNLSGALYLHYDEAGLLTYNSFDFKGNLVEKSRRLVKDEVLLSVFANAGALNWNVPAWTADWPSSGDLAAYNTLLEGAGYTTTTSYDALSRIKSVQYPESVNGDRKKLRPHYNASGALEKVMLDNTVYVSRIAYNAKGQRVLIAYGNGVMTRYAYDPKTFRMLRLRSERYTLAGPATYQPQGAALQDMAYEYDLLGNIRVIKDRTPGAGIPGSALGADALDRTFIYDALYRLKSATGRECETPPDFPWDETPRCVDLTKTKNYTEQYWYDKADNIQQLKHTGSNATYVRKFELTPGTNRLQTVEIGQTTLAYSYDRNGNLKQETASRYFDWDHANRLKAFRTQTPNAEPSVYTRYLYDTTGQRVKKLTRKQGAKVETTIYIDGLFELQSISQGGTSIVNNTLHVLDTRRRIALIRIGNPFPGDTTPANKYHLSDQVGNSCLVLDDAGTWINREEYSPFGETSFGGFAQKRYRYTGKERDQESGMSYHGARYYASWILRWVSCDPLGPADGLNLYRYASNNPIRLTDPTGMQSCNDSSGGVCPSTNATETPVAEDSSGGPPNIRPQPVQEAEHQPRRQPREPEIIPTPPDLKFLPHPKDAKPMGQFDNAVKDTIGDAFALPRQLDPSGKFSAPIKEAAGVPETPPEAKGFYYYATRIALGSVLALGFRPNVNLSPQQGAPVPTPNAAGTSAVVNHNAKTEAAALFEARDEATRITDKLIAQELEAGQITASQVPTRYGTIADAVFKSNVRQAVAEGNLPRTFVTSPTVALNRGFTRNWYKAPDVWDTTSGRSWDLMTPKSSYFYQHEMKYLGQVLPDGTVATEVNPLFYFRGNF